MSDKMKTFFRHAAMTFAGIILLVLMVGGIAADLGIRWDIQL